MKYTKDFEKLGLPEDFKFGIELEAYNVKTKGKNSLYSGKSAEYIKNKNWHMATKREEKLVGMGGAELVSNVLQDTPQNWKTLFEMCAHIKKFPINNKEEVVANDKCGLHVHFDANCLTQNPKRLKTFLRLYAESEELLYKMCNDKNNPIRKSAINKNFRGLGLISSLWRNGVASPTGKKILKQIQNNSLKVSYKKFGKLKMFASKYKLDERRYSGLNLTNIGNPKKNTIEFRMANGTLNPEVIKQTVFLYSSLINTAIKITENPDNYKNSLNEFFKTDVTEAQKAFNFLNLIIENPEDRKIYIERWNSVKNAPVFQKNYKKGFSKDRFKREEFKNIASRTPSNSIHLVYSYLKNSVERNKGVVSYDR